MEKRAAVVQYASAEMDSKKGDRETSGLVVAGAAVLLVDKAPWLNGWRL